MGIPRGISAWDEIASGSVLDAKNATIMVAASNASTRSKKAADFIATGTNDGATITAAIAALPTVGGTIRLSEGTFSHTSTDFIFQLLNNGTTFTDDFIIIEGAGLGATTLRQLGTGDGINIIGGIGGAGAGGEILNTILRNFSLQGSNLNTLTTRGRGIYAQNLKDGLIDNINITAFSGDAIYVSGTDTYNGVIRRCRITAGTPVMAAGARSLRIDRGNAWRSEYNYFNTGGTNVAVRYETVIDVVGSFNFISFANIFDGATTGIRSQASLMSINEFWDFSATTGITGFAHIHGANSALTTISAAMDINKISLGAGVSPNVITLIGGSARNSIGGTNYQIHTTPSTITTNVNDYVPTVTDTAYPASMFGVWRLSSDIERTITGIVPIVQNAGLTNAQTIYIFNVGANNIILSENNIASAAANRMLFPGGFDLVLRSSYFAILTYDPVLLRWRGILSSPDNATLDVISPSAIIATTNNYAPTGARKTKKWRISSTGEQSITGIDVGSLMHSTGEPYILYLTNIGADPISFINESALSSASNRFTNSGGYDITLRQRDTAMLLYDLTTARWRINPQITEANTANLIEPTTIIANQASYTPTSSRKTKLWRIASDAARTIFGIGVSNLMHANGEAGYTLSLVNIGAFTITLANESISAGAANERIVSRTGVDFALTAGLTVQLVYDPTATPSGTAGRWRMI